MKTSKTPEHPGIGCVAELLGRGAAIDPVNKAGMTPLHEACLMGARDVVDLLLEHNADVNKLSAAGESCLFLFLSRRLKVSEGALLGKLCCLSFPLRLRDHKGRLPSTWTHAGFRKQRALLLQFIGQPRRLQDICKCFVYLKHDHRRREDLRGILPPRVYDFVFSYWEDLHIFSGGRGERGFSSNV